MRLGFALPFADLGGGPLGPTTWADAARVAEDLGYSSVWTFDAVGRGFMLPDPLMALAMAASATDQIELGTGIMQLPIRNVVEVAHRLLTLEVISPDRVLFGVGPGSTETDFTVYGGDYSARFKTFEDQWAELQMLVSSGALDGRDLNAWPQVLGGPTLMLAGWRGEWVERAASESAGWIASGMYATDEELAGALARYRNAGGTRAIVTNVQAGDDVGPVIERINHLGSIGFDDVVVIDLQATQQRMQQLAEQTVGAG